MDKVMDQVARLAIPLLAVAVAWTASACGAPGASAPLTAAQVDKSIWHSGWKVTFGTARIVRGEASPVSTGPGSTVVTIDVTLINLGTRQWSFRACGPTDLRDGCADTDLVLSSGGRHYSDAAPQQDLPKVPGKSSQHGTIAFVVDDNFRLDDAILTVGDPEFRQAVVPLTGAEGLVALEPRVVPVTGTVKVDDFAFAVRGAEVRADSPERYWEAKAGREFMRLSYSVTNTGPCVVCGGQLRLEANHLLRTPDGSTLSPSDRCGGAAYPQPGNILRDQLLCYEVPTPTNGSYTFFYKNRPTEGITFEIGA